ncbi:hypothetical protein SBA1_460024 [Candidatus Sulfotelmatobacter kueseliae]|uniref:Uncharacterized protein n=1 Tax=Candidatus Sulfotelmatobacter kueseliae TaxID=2042962 RepID=A0A2U3KS84_9BACT|nr:hypothetical protein SBA1_460024 [Candidatus Sulfotelmatobacter kueseliae]
MDVNPKPKPTNPTTEPVRISAGSFFPPTRFRCDPGNFGALLRGKGFRPRLSTLFPTSPTLHRFRVPLALADGVFDFAAGNIEYQFGKLIRIAGSGTFNHGCEYATGHADCSTPSKFKLRHYPQSSFPLLVRCV